MAWPRYRPPSPGSASLAAFQRWIEPQPMARSPQGPPSRQWLARQPRFSTEPLGLGAVARIPTARVGEERPLPQPRAAAPLPAPAAERGGREIISTLRPPGGETLEELETRLSRERAAGTLGNEETRAAYMAGELTLAQAQGREDVMWKRADDLARLSQERERGTEEAARQDTAMVETIAQTLRDAGRDPMTVYQTAWDWVNAGQGPEQLAAFRKGEQEREAGRAKLAQREAGLPLVAPELRPAAKAGVPLPTLLAEPRTRAAEQRAEARGTRAAAPQPTVAESAFERTAVGLGLGSDELRDFMALSREDQEKWVSGTKDPFFTWGQRETRGAHQQNRYAL